MKSLIKTLAMSIILPITLFGCSEKETSEETPAKPHLYDYEQTLLQLGIDGTSLQSNVDTYKSLNYSPQRSMWFTVNDYPDILLNKTEKEFTENIEKRFKDAVSIGINTVYVHARAYGDSYYSKSELFPKGLYMAEDISYDPLEIIVNKAHELNLSVHAWINPLRCQSETQMKEISDSFTIKKWYNEQKGRYISDVEGRYWLCPAYPEVREFIAEGAAEIVENYDVDGIHIDDYFYPTADPSFDAEAFSESSTSDLSAFRKEQCSLLVSEMYNAVKALNPEVLFGISPQGTLAGNDSQYADVQRWCSEEGFCDYIVPQIYFGLENETVPFAETAALWQNLVTNEDTELIIGICTYKMGREDIYAGKGKDEWLCDNSVISKEAEIISNMGLGIALYSYDSTFCPADDVAEDMEKERQCLADILTK